MSVPVYSAHSKSIPGLMERYALTKTEAESVWDLGNQENAELTIRGNLFSSGRRRGEQDEYYIDVYGPNGHILTCYNYEG